MTGDSTSDGGPDAAEEDADAADAERPDPDSGGPSGRGAGDDSEQADETGSDMLRESNDHGDDVSAADKPDRDRSSDGPALEADRTAAPARRGSTASERGDSSGDETGEPHVSVTIEGEYDTVFERLEHPQGVAHSELDSLVSNIEETLFAVGRAGGGIRSEIYEVADFELDRPWEIRIYLEVLAMHDLIRLQDDEWVPSDAYQGTADEDRQ